jgi:hypothetical protein
VFCFPHCHWPHSRWLNSCVRIDFTSRRQRVDKSVSYHQVSATSCGSLQLLFCTRVTVFGDLPPTSLRCALDRAFPRVHWTTFPGVSSRCRCFPFGDTPSPPSLAHDPEGLRCASLCYSASSAHQHPMHCCITLSTSSVSSIALFNPAATESYAYSPLTSNRQILRPYLQASATTTRSLRL